jgi:hypothetical protein
MFDAATVVHPTLNHDDEARVHDHDHWKSPHVVSASSLTPLKERGRRRDRDDQDLRDLIHDRDARGWIENWRQKHERLQLEQHEERDYDYYGPYYDQPHQQHSPEGRCNARVVKAFSQDLMRVRWPPNFKRSGIEKYDGSTNLVEWLEVY